MNFGCQSMVGEIGRLLLKHPKEAFLSQQKIQADWENLNYLGCPDYEKALDEYEDFVGLLKSHVDTIHYLPKNRETSLDSIYAHDPVIVTKRGAILCNMQKKQRETEPNAVRDFLHEIDVPVLGRISGEGRLEGGDVVWIDEHTLAIGQGYRTNAEGIRQLRELTKDFVDELISVPLPHWQGPEDVMHLMSFISPIDRNLAAVYSRLMPVPFREWLIARGIKLLEVPDSEYETMACNILAVAPGKCIMLSGNPQTKKMLEHEGVEVWEYVGEEISQKGAGGPTCLTRPILRD